MANELRKITDQNGVDHPVCDDTRVTWSSYAKTGVHNINGTKYFDDTIAGITWTVNADGSVAANGATGDSSSSMSEESSNGFIAPYTGMFKATGSPDVPNFGAAMLVYDWTDSHRAYTDSSKTAVTGDVIYGYPLSFYMEKGHKYSLILRIQKNTTVSNVVFYPLITDIDDKNTDYTPYAMTNEELTDEVAVKKSTITLAQNVTSDGNSVTKQGKVVDYYLHVTTMPDTSSGDVVLGTIPFRPVSPNAFFTIRSNSTPFAPITSGFIRSSTGELVIKTGAMDGQTACYVSGTYICQ